MIPCKNQKLYAKMFQRGKTLEVKKMRKLGILLVITLLLLGLMPGLATAVTYNNDVPSGLTLLAWAVGPNQSGKDTVISFLYTGGFHASNEIDAPFNSSWHSLDDARPILLAEQEGYRNYLGGTNGVFGTNIKFSDNVLAAMKVQNFNPAQVGGANIPPSSTTLNSDQIAWLQKMGYSVQSPGQSTTTSTQTQASASTQSVQSSEQQTQTSPPAPTSSSQTTASSSSESAQTSQKISQPTVKLSAGDTVKTPSGPVTPQMAATDKQLAAENPPSLNPANIPIKLPVKEETMPSQRNIWLWAAAGAVILALGAVAGRIIYVKHRAA